MGRSKKHCIRQENHGFTLIEIIVVLVIMGILLAIAVPTILGYVNKTDDLKNDLRIHTLNTSSQSLRIYKYADGTLTSDIFDGVNENKERQDVLLGKNLLDEYMTNINDDNDYFYWDTKDQLWKLDKNSNKPSGEVDLDHTILGDITNKDNNNRGEWVKQDYKYGDIAFVIDKNGNKVFYKYVNKEYSSQREPDAQGRIDWKIIKLDFDEKNRYEVGDIILFNGEYYKSNVDPEGFLYDKTNYGLTNEQLIKKCFTKQAWDGSAFEDAS